MHSSTEFQLDYRRAERIGFDEAVFCLNKTVPQIDAILTDAQRHHKRFLLTRLARATFDALGPDWRAHLDYHEPSATAYFGEPQPIRGPARVVAVAAGTSDAMPAWEAVRTLRFNGLACDTVFDVGVAGLWRLLERVDTLRDYPVVIAVAGMDAALPSVLGGLLPGAIVAIPTSTGYGVATGGHTALNAILASCAPGVSVVNIDNGYGAACAALRIVRQLERVATVDATGSADAMASR